MDQMKRGNTFIFIFPTTTSQKIIPEGKNNLIIKKIFNRMIIKLFMNKRKENTFKWPPDECNMPDLSDLDAPLLNRLMAFVMTGKDQEHGEKGKQYLRYFIRLFDKAYLEYNEAREAIMHNPAQSGR